MCIIKVDFKETPENLFSQLCKMGKSYNTKISGNSQKGDFEIKVAALKFSGHYTVTAQTALIRITKKPFFISCKRIELLIKDYLA